MSDLRRAVIDARPNLRAVLPVVFWQTFVFSVLNLLLGFGLWLWKPTSFPVIAPNPMALKIWAAVFFLTGVAMAFGIVKKRWETLRSLMFMAFMFKVLWSFALYFRIVDGGTLLVAVLFTGLAALQMIAIIFYSAPLGARDARRY